MRAVRDLQRVGASRCALIWHNLAVDLGEYRDLLRAVVHEAQPRVRAQAKVLFETVRRVLGHEGDVLRRRAPARPRARRPREQDGRRVADGGGDQLHRALLVAQQERERGGGAAVGGFPRVLAARVVVVDG